MSWSPLRPAPLGDGAWGSNALVQAQQHCLDGNHLPGRWADQARFVVMDTDFGLGHAFLATWAAWQQDARRCDQLWYLAIAAQPPRAADLRRVHAGSSVAPQAAALVAAWPPLTPDLHLIELDGGRVRLLLALGPVGAVLPEWVAQVDAFYLADFVAARSPSRWDTWRLRQLTRLAAHGATLVSANSHSTVRDGLRSAGFELDPLPSDGVADTDTGTLTHGRFAPRFPTQPPPGRLAAWAAEILAHAEVPTLLARPAARRVAVIGAGLAGAAVARALARRGLAVQVFERQPGCAQETSGNPGGLFHGIVHGHDGPHARWLRAAALHTERVLRPLLRAGPGSLPRDADPAAPPTVDGAIAGLLRGEPSAQAATLQALISKLALPPDYVQVRQHAFAGTGLAWFYPGGGWVSPADLCAAWLATPGVSCHYGAVVAQIQPRSAGANQAPPQPPLAALPRPTDSDGWRLLDAAGRCLAEVDAVLLCNASGAGELLAPLVPDAVASWPLQRVRGQTSVLPADTEGLPTLPCPLTDGGYALQLTDGRLLCGASSHAGDEDPTLREPDHAHNLAQLRRLSGWAGGTDPAAVSALSTLDGRVGWRLQSGDRLPLLGPVPAPAWSTPQAAADPDEVRTSGPASRRLDQPRWWPRLPGLYVFTALGSRGITQAALGAEVLASWLTGDPVPAPASLLDALDPARFLARAARRKVPPASS